MTLRRRFAAAAQDELRAAHDWYERESPGVGVEFVAAVEKATKNAADWPSLAPREVVPGETREFRRAGVERFPYRVVYVVVDDDVLLIMAVAHNRRRPGYWHDRVRD